MWSYRPNAEDSTLLNRDSGVLTVDGSSWTMPAPGTTIPNSTDLPNPGVRVVTGTTDTLVLADNGKTIYCTNGSACTVTIPLNASVPFPLNTHIQFASAIGVVFSASGITAIIQNGAIDGQYFSGKLTKVATNIWVIDSVQQA